MRDIINAAREYGMFQRRADVAVYDWDIADFPVHNRWYDLDITSIVPEHAHAILLRAIMRATATGKYFELRDKGYVNSQCSSYIDVSVANIYERQDMQIGIGPNRIIQGNKIQLEINAIFLVIKGWWF